MQIKGRLAIRAIGHPESALARPFAGEVTIVARKLLPRQSDAGKSRSADVRGGRLEVSFKKISIGRPSRGRAQSVEAFSMAACVIRVYALRASPRSGEAASRTGSEDMT